MRLDKYISKALGVSRKVAKELIRQGRVWIDGKVIKKADFKVSPNAKVVIDGEELELKEKIYLMLYKPKGYLSTTEREADYPSFLDLLPEYEHLKPFAAGRLDVDAEGFLLVTNDGLFAHRITHPRWGVSKTYEVVLEKPLSSEDIAKLLRGEVKIGGKPIKVKEIKPLEENRVLLTLTEGKYHIVKRLFRSLGNKVLYLKRVAIGGVTLDPSLREGEYRELTEEEVKKLKRLVKLE
ncbi:MAG: 16S rRNA pseudouridine(516) synthase [Gammaproteobacteria bacterium]|nr:MAG: 16S rRNA pseudouridine(516) synthase [Gammaproteobacteria bacterium]